jgi:hypothetical protein
MWIGLVCAFGVWLLKEVKKSGGAVAVH